MATIDLTRTRGKHKKRGISVFSTIIDTGPDGEYFTSEDIFQLFILPERSLILSAGTIILVANDGTTATADIGFDGGAEILDDDNLAAAADTVVESALTPIWMPTGGIVTITPTYTGTATEGEVLFWMNYLEVDKTTGELTRFITNAFPT